MFLDLDHDESAHLVRLLTGRPDYLSLAELADRAHDRCSWRSTYAWLVSSDGTDLTADYAADHESEVELPTNVLHSTWHAMAESAPWRFDDFHNERYLWSVEGLRSLYHCEHCDRFRMDYQWVDNDSTRLCESCADECPSCDSCGQRWSSDEGASECCYSSDWDDEEDGCSCPDCNGGSSVDVHSYNYKPCPQMHGSARHHFGVEIEIEANGRGNLDDLVSSLAQDDESDYYLKQDGSIDNGVELVTHPRSLTSWQDYSGQLGTILNAAANAGGRAWDAPRCGLHVHVSRTAFLSESHLYAFTLLIEENVSPLTRFAGRHSEQWASFNKDKRGIDLDEAVKPGRRGDRYMAVNLNNPDTVELRFFRPSLKVRSVLAAVELVDALVSFTKYSTTSGILAGDNDWAHFRSFLEDNEEQYSAAVEVMTKRVKVTSAPIDPSTVEE